MFIRFCGRHVGDKYNKRFEYDVSSAALHGKVRLKRMLGKGANANMSINRDRVCPVGRAGSLDNIFRRWLQNPLKILAPFIQDGMVALDIGCGPGFFTLTMAQLVGTTGRVIGVDLQEGMLEKIRRKIEKTNLESRIALHKCERNSIGVVEQVDFVLLFYMVHEITNKEQFFNELAGILKSTGKALIVEPPLHVSKAAFERTIRTAEKAGFKHSCGPHILLSKTAILQKAQQDL